MNCPEGAREGGLGHTQGRIFCTPEKFYVNHDAFVLRVFLRVIIGNEFVRTRRAYGCSRREEAVREVGDVLLGKMYLNWPVLAFLRCYVNCGNLMPHMIFGGIVGRGCGKSGVRTVRAPQGGLSCPYGAIHLQAGPYGRLGKSGVRTVREAGPYGRFREVGGIWCGKSVGDGGNEPPPYDRVREVFRKSVGDGRTKAPPLRGGMGGFREFGSIPPPSVRTGHLPLHKGGFWRFRNSEMVR